MGTLASKPVETLSPPVIAFFVASLQDTGPLLGNSSGNGNSSSSSTPLGFKQYTKAITENGIDGEFLASLSLEEFQETLDELEVADPHHREKLSQEFQRCFLNRKKAPAPATTFTKSSLSSLSSMSAAATTTTGMRNTVFNKSKLNTPRFANYIASASGRSSFEIASASRGQLINSDMQQMRTLPPRSASFNMEALQSLTQLARSTSLESMTLMQRCQSLTVLQQQQQQNLGESGGGRSRSSSASKRRHSKKFCVAPPTGKVAICLTDIQGSTALWEANTPAMRRALHLHDKVVRRASEQYYGYQIGTEGDAFFLAFHDATDAICFGLEVQQRLNEAPWADDILAQPWAAPDASGRRGLRIRVTIHMGQVQVRENAVTGRTQYAGPAMKYTKCLESQTNGGQIITTLETWQDAWNMTVASKTNNDRNNDNNDDDDDDVDDFDDDEQKGSRRIKAMQQLLQSAKLAHRGTFTAKDGVTKSIVELAPASFQFIGGDTDDAKTDEHHTNAEILATNTNSSATANKTQNINQGSTDMAITISPSPTTTTGGTARSAAATACT